MNHCGTAVSSTDLSKRSAPKRSTSMDLTAPMLADSTVWSWTRQASYRGGPTLSTETHVLESYVSMEDSMKMSPSMIQRPPTATPKSISKRTRSVSTCLAAAMSPSKNSPGKRTMSSDSPGRAPVLDLPFSAKESESQRRAPPRSLSMSSHQRYTLIGTSPRQAKARVVLTDRALSPREVPARSTSMPLATRKRIACRTTGDHLKFPPRVPHRAPSPSLATRKTFTVDDFAIGIGSLSPREAPSTPSPSTSTQLFFGDVHLFESSTRAPPRTPSLSSPNSPVCGESTIQVPDSSGPLCSCEKSPEDDDPATAPSRVLPMPSPKRSLKGCLSPRRVPGRSVPLKRGTGSHRRAPLSTASPGHHDLTPVMSAAERRMARRQALQSAHIDQGESDWPEGDESKNAGKFDPFYQDSGNISFNTASTSEDSPLFGEGGMHKVLTTYTDKRWSSFEAAEVDSWIECECESDEFMEGHVPTEEV